MGSYSILLATLWIVNMDYKRSALMTIVYLLTLATFLWIAYYSSESKSVKMDVNTDRSAKHHLVSHVLKRIENREFQ